MVIFRQYIAPFIALIIFLLALVAVSARIFLPADMAAPAPIEEVSSDQHAQGLRPGGVRVFGPGRGNVA